MLERFANRLHAVAERISDVILVGVVAQVRLEDRNMAGEMET